MTSVTIRPDTHQRRAVLLEEARAQIVVHYPERDFDVNRLARLCSTSRRQLQRVLADEGGFRSMVIRQRMNVAGVMLREYPHLSVRKIAFSVGYSAPAQFARTFRETMGKAPREWRGQS